MPTRVFLRVPDDSILSLSSSSMRLAGPSDNRSFRRTIKRRSTLSSKDISASSRLSGYLLIFIAYVVLLVSSIKNDPVEEDSNLPPISEWKRMSAMIGSASFSGLVSFIVLIHFDTFCAPNLWLKIFKDGSLGEGIILFILFFAAIFMIYVSTSVDGIGGVVGKNYNVYFSSWMGFFTCVYTFGLWKKDAVLNSVSFCMYSLNFYYY